MSCRGRGASRRPVALRCGGGGGGAGKASLQDLHFVSHISKASPKLFLSCATGTHHKTASLSGVRTAARAVE